MEHPKSSAGFINRLFYGQSRVGSLIMSLMRTKWYRYRSSRDGQFSVLP